MWATPPANTVVILLPRFSKGREEVGPGSQTSHSLRHECTNRVIVDTTKLQSISGIKTVRELDRDQVKRKVRMLS